MNHSNKLSSSSPKRHIYRELRDFHESKGDMPTKMRSLNVIGFEELEMSVINNDEEFAEKLFNSLWAGDVYIVKNAFSPDWVNKLKADTIELFKETESTFHKMKEGVPNFHRVIDESVSKNYAISAIKHSAYFFPWNPESSKMFEEVNRRWRLFKYIGGFEYDEYVGNTPKDEIVDRIQVCIYPKGLGSLGSHSDPFHNQRFFISGFLSDRGGDGADYEEGGFYTVDQQGDHIDAEPFIGLGDMAFGYATVHHGVKKIDPESHRKYDPHNPMGRWFLGLYSNDSDEKKNRITSYRVNS